MSQLLVLDFEWVVPAQARPTHVSVGRVKGRPASQKTVFGADGGERRKTQVASNRIESEIDRKKNSSQKKKGTYKRIVGYTCVRNATAACKRRALRCSRCESAKHGFNGGMCRAATSKPRGAVLAARRKYVRRGIGWVK